MCTVYTVHALKQHVEGETEQNNIRLRLLHTFFASIPKMFVARLRARENKMNIYACARVSHAKVSMPNKLYVYLEVNHFPTKLSLNRDLDGITASP